MKLATLLYIKNSKGEYLLIERTKMPNMGLLSPPGGKVILNPAESPVACAVREGEEECGLISEPKNWKLLGIVTENNYPNIGNIMLFLYEYDKPFEELPQECNEGGFRYVHPDFISCSPIPETDKLYIWNFVLKNTGRLFSIYIDCEKEPFECVIEQE